MKTLGDVSEGGFRSADKSSNYQAEPLGRSVKASRCEQKKDPYVVRATERAKVKIRNRIFE